jgi:hypothetical protein
MRSIDSVTVHWRTPVTAMSGAAGPPDAATAELWSKAAANGYGAL